MAHRKKTATFRVLHTNPKRQRGTRVSPLLPRWRVGLVLQFFCDEPYKVVDDVLQQSVKGLSPLEYALGAVKLRRSPVTNVSSRSRSRAISPASRQIPVSSLRQPRTSPQVRNGAASNAAEPSRHEFEECPNPAQLTFHPRGGKLYLGGDCCRVTIMGCSGLRQAQIGEFAFVRRGFQDENQLHYRTCPAPCRLR